VSILKAVGHIWRIIYYEKENGDIPVEEHGTATKHMDDYLRRRKP
jgi:hypothetical protein